MATRSAVDRASSWSCVTSRPVAPCAAKMSRTSPRSRVRSDASKAEKGSSRSTRSGSGAKARASDTRCAWPPDSSAGMRCASSGMPTTSSNSITRSGTRRPRRANGERGVRRPRPKPTLSATSRCGKSDASCGTRPTRRRSGGTPDGPSTTRRPARSTVPAVAGMRPASTRNSVVLPQPLGPRTPSSSPSGTSRWTSWSTGASAAPRPEPGYPAHRPATDSAVAAGESDAGIRAVWACAVIAILRGCGRAPGRARRPPR